MQMPSLRDAKIDFARGLALLVIFSDHIRGNVLSNFSPMSVSYTSMLEVFLFLSGYVCGLSYRRVFNRCGIVECAFKVTQRCVQVYCAHITTAILVLTVFIAWASFISTSDVNTFGGYTNFHKSGNQFLVGILVLTQRVSDFDILPMYLSLLPALPAILLLERRSPLLISLTSILVYFAANRLQLALLPQWPWTFNPFAWQILFCAGVLLSSPRAKGLHWLPRGVVPFVVSFVILEILFLAKLFAPESVPFTNRENLDALRIVHFACIVMLARPILQRFDFLTARWTRPILLCGRQSLPTYCSGVILANLSSLAGAHFDYSSTWSFLVNGIGWLGCIGTAWISERLKSWQSGFSQKH